MKLLKILPVFIGLSLHGLTASAGSVSPTCSIAFGELLSEGLRTHPSITVSRQLLQASDLQLNSANWAYYPTPTLDISGSLSNTRTTIRIDQPIWDGGKIDAIYGHAKAQKDEAVSSYGESQYKLIENYIDTLKKYLQAQDKISIMNSGLVQLEGIMETIDRMIAAEELSRADKNLLNTKIAAINSTLTVANAEFDVAKIQFEILTGKKIECDVVLISADIFNADIDIEKLIEDSLYFDPALRILNARIGAAETGVASAKSKLWPALKLRAEHRNGALYDTDNGADQTLIYLALEMSTGAGASVLTDIERSKINVLKAKNQKLAKEKQVIDALIKNYTSFVAVKNNIEILSSDVEVAEEVFNSNKRLFFLQQKRWIDMVNALIVWNNKKISKFNLIEDYKALEMKLALKTNRLSLETGGVL